MEEEKGHHKRKARQVVEKTAHTTIRVTATIVKIVFILIIVFTVLVTIWQYFDNRDQFLTTIATVSVGGFWAFFLGYFGWRMGQTVELYLHNLKKNK